MAIQYVGGRGGGRAGSTSTLNVAINSGLTGGIGSAAIAGDLVVVTVAVGTQGRNPSCAVSGYTAKTQQHTTATTYDISLCTSHKIMPTTPDANVTIPATGNTADGQGYEIHVFRGVDPSQVEDVVATYLTGSGTNNRPDPQAIQPTTPGAVIYCGGGGAASTGTTVFTAAYLSGFLSHNGVDTNDGTAGAGFLFWNGSGSYDPAVWGGGSVNAANSWGATTLALRPYVPPPVEGAGEEDGQSRDETASGIQAFSGAADQSDQPRDEDATGAMTTGFVGSATEEGQPRDEAATGALAFSGTGAENEQARDEAGAAALLFAGGAIEEEQPGNENAAGILAFQGAATEDEAARDQIGIGALIFAGVGGEDGQPRDETASGAQLFAAVGSEDGQPHDEVAAGALAFIGGGEEEMQPRDELAAGGLIFAGTGTQESQPRDESGEAYQGSLIFGMAAEERQPSDEDGVVFHSVVIIGFAEQRQEPHDEDGLGWIKGVPVYGESQILAHTKADSLIMSTFLGESIFVRSIRAETPMRIVHG